jgi:hypothetical protein
MNPFLKVPTRYWFISCMGALWFAMGALDYVMISYKDSRLYGNYAGRSALLV